MLKKLGYKWHLLVKNPKLWIYKCKINFYKCKLTCDKKLCQVIHSRSEICWKKPKYTKKMSFWRNFFYQICPACPPAVSAQKLSALKFYSFWHFSHIFLVWEAKKTNRFMLGNMVFSGPQIDHFGQKSHFWSEISAEWGPAARPYPASTSWLVK